MKITGIWLTKNSEKFIGYSLSSLINTLDQVIVIDSGSIDNTREIILSLGQPKIQLISLDGKTNMDEAFAYGFRYFDGDVVLLLGDDYIWDNKNATELREWCQRGIALGKKGLLCSVFNLGFRPNEYFSCVTTIFVSFQQKNNPLMCVGSFMIDNFTIVHKDETRMKKNKLCPKIRPRFYLSTPLTFTHWKYLKDTKEYFIYKFLLFQQHFATLEDAEQKWEAMQKQEMLEYPHPMPEVFTECREQFVPLGGFDIRRY